MGRYEYAAAEAEFQAAVKSAPDWLTARVNLAIATLNRQNDGDERLALDILARALDIDPDEPRALYTSGILHFQLGEIEAAKARFARVVELDPEDAHAAYYLGLTHLQDGNNETAAKWLLRSAKLDEHLLSAFYTGSLALRRSGRIEEAERLLDTYQRLQSNPCGAPGRDRLQAHGTEGGSARRDAQRGAAARAGRGAAVRDPTDAGDADRADRRHDYRRLQRRRAYRISCLGDRFRSLYWLVGDRANSTPQQTIRSRARKATPSRYGRTWTRTV